MTCESCSCYCSKKTCLSKTTIISFPGKRTVTLEKSKGCEATGASCRGEHIKYSPGFVEKHCSEISPRIPRNFHWNVVDWLRNCIRPNLFSDFLIFFHVYLPPEPSSETVPSYNLQLSMLCTCRSVIVSFPLFVPFPFKMPLFPKRFNESNLEEKKMLNCVRSNTYTDYFSKYGPTVKLFSLLSSWICRNGTILLFIDFTFVTDKQDQIKRKTFSFLYD